MVGFCSGTIAGLVAATPSSGYVPPWASLVIGVVTGAVCNYATKIKFLVHVDDALDLFAEHAIGGTVGLLANGLFGDSAIVALDGVTQIEGGWINHNWKQLYKQFAYICACYAYTFVVTALLAKGVDMIPGMHLRASMEAETMGMDEDQIGEFATDYIEIRRDFLDWTPPNDGLRSSTNDIEDVHDKTHAYAAGDRHGTAEHGTSHHVTHHPEGEQADKVRDEKTAQANGLSTVHE